MNHYCNNKIFLWYRSTCKRNERLCKNIDGNVLMKRNVPCNIKVFMNFIEPFKKSLTVGVESLITGIWLLDELKKLNITCALGMPST
jgi:hypothetical protein